MCITQTARNGGRYGPFRRLVSYRGFDPVIHGKPATAGSMANPEGCVMCDRPAGAAGTPRAPRRHSTLRGFSYQGGFFRRSDGIQLAYGQPTDSIRTAYS